MQSISQTRALDEIVDVLNSNTSSDAPFVFVLGAGFSAGLVPTTSDLVKENIPLWIHAKGDTNVYREMLGAISSERAGIARRFWAEFVRRNLEFGIDLHLNAETGLPNVPSEAYKAAFSPRFSGALSQPKRAREFQRELIRSSKPGLNLSHFLLASLLALQPSGRTGDRFKTKSALSRLIFTTNFDSYLQRALQATNQLYYMSDIPDLDIGPDLLDPSHDAIHLVYIHGSIHRQVQAASEEDIRDCTKKHAGVLRTILGSRGVIVLGYSGWDDAIVEALHDCAKFDLGLYWMGLESDPRQPGKYGPKVPKILEKRSARFVQISSADDFMVKLWGRLAKGRPPLLSHPIRLVEDLVNSITLHGNSPPSHMGLPDKPEFHKTHSEDPVNSIRLDIQETIRRLKTAQDIFQKDHLQHVLTSAVTKFSLSLYDEAVQECDDGLNICGLSGLDRNKLLLLRGHSRVNLKLIQDALSDYGAVITAMVDMPAEGINCLAEALVSRGLIYGRVGNHESALSDFSRVVDTCSNASADFIAEALVNRAVSYLRIRSHSQCLDDLTRVISNLPGASVFHVTQSLINRGFVHMELNEFNKALGDFSSVINDTPGAPTEGIARALIARGYTHETMNCDSAACADYSRVVDELPGAPADQVAQALIRRGSVRSRLGEVSEALADYSLVISQACMVPSKAVGLALIGRGLLLHANGQIDEALSDLTRAVDSLPDAPRDVLAQALANRGWVHYKAERWEDFLRDESRALEIDPKLGNAAINRCLALLTVGRDAEALDRYRKAVLEFPKDIAAARKDVDEAVGKWLTPERAKPVLEILKGDPP